MEVDMSDYTMEGVLFIECKNRQQRLVAYLSKSLNKIERNYKIYNREMLAIIRGLENWKHLLKGAKFKFKVWTDHKNLKVQKLNRKQAYQVLYLLRFDFTLKYILETKMRKIDGLSRRLDQKVDIEKNNEN